jgi:hypothetical protein
MVGIYTKTRRRCTDRDELRRAYPERSRSRSGGPSPAQERVEEGGDGQAEAGDGLLPEVEERDPHAGAGRGAGPLQVAELHVEAPLAHALVGGAPEVELDGVGARGHGRRVSAAGGGVQVGGQVAL